MANHSKGGRISNMQIVKEYYDGKRSYDELSYEVEQYERSVRMAYGMHLEIKSQKYIVGSLMKTFNITQSTAYKVLKEAKLIFADLVEINKAIERNLAIEMAKESYRRAVLRDNTSDMVNATKALIKAAGLDKEDPDLPDFSKIQPSVIVPMLPEGMEDSILEMLQGGAVDLNKVPETIDVNHEEV
jgi:hypothetical protein